MVLGAGDNRPTLPEGIGQRAGNANPKTNANSVHPLVATHPAHSAADRPHLEQPYKENKRDRQTETTTTDIQEEGATLGRGCV